MKYTQKYLILTRSFPYIQNPCRVIIIDTFLFLDGAPSVPALVDAPPGPLRGTLPHGKLTHPLFETTRARPVARRYVKSRFFYASLTRRFIRSNKGTRSFVRSFVRSFPRVCAHYSSSCRDIRERRIPRVAFECALRGLRDTVGAKLGGNARVEIVCVGFGTFRARCVVAKRAVGRKDGPWGGVKHEDACILRCWV